MLRRCSFFLISRSCSQARRWSSIRRASAASFAVFVQKTGRSAFVGGFEEDEDEEEELDEAEEEEEED